MCKKIDLLNKKVKCSKFSSVKSFVYYDPNTMEVYDTTKNYIGIGEFNRNNAFEITRDCSKTFNISK